MKHRIVIALALCAAGSFALAVQPVYPVKPRPEGPTAKPAEAWPAKTAGGSTPGTGSVARGLDAGGSGSGQDRLNFFGFGVLPVYDAKSDLTRKAEAALHLGKFVEQLAELRKTYVEVKGHYDLAVRMSRYIRNMAQRYKAVFGAQHRIGAGDVDAFFGTADRLLGVTNGDVDTAQGAGLPQIRQAYDAIRANLDQWDPAALEQLPSDLLRDAVRKDGGVVGLAGAANLRAYANIANVSSTARDVAEKVKNLEDDALSGDDGINSQVAVLNKINAALVMQMRQLQDTNRLLSSLLEQQGVGLVHTANGETERLNRIRHVLQEREKIYTRDWEGTDGAFRSFNW